MRDMESKNDLENIANVLGSAATIHIRFTNNPNVLGGTGFT